MHSKIQNFLWLQKNTGKCVIQKCNSEMQCMSNGNGLFHNSKISAPLPAGSCKLINKKTSGLRFLAVTLVLVIAYNHFIEECVSFLCRSWRVFHTNHPHWRTLRIVRWVFEPQTPFCVGVMVGRGVDAEALMMCKQLHSSATTHVQSPGWRHGWAASRESRTILN